MKTLIKIYKKAGKYKLHIFIAALATLFVTAVNLVTPKLTQEMIKLLDSDNNTADPVHTLIIIAFALLGMYVLRAVAQFVQSYVGHWAAWRFVADIQTEIYAHLQRLSASFFSNKKTGELMSRVVNDTRDFEMLIAHAVPELVSGGLLFVGISFMLFSINPALAALTFIPVPFILLAAPLFKKTRKNRKKAQEHMGELNAALQDNLSGIKEIQLWNKEKHEEQKVEHHAQKHSKSLLKALLYMAVMNPLVGFLTSAGNVIVVGVGGYLVLNNHSSHGMSLDEIVAFLLYLSIFYGPVANVTRIVEDMQAGIAGGERVYEILETQPEITDSPDAKDVGRLSGNIEFRNVNFKYADESETFTLQDVSFTIPARKMFAVIGQTGVGKTTLAALLPRFYDVTGGEILIDNIPIKSMTLHSLRNNISMVLQDVFLWGGTLRENICYGKPEATDGEIIRAAKTACIHDFIAGLPLGYETIVGERGIRLSGGQKQRVSIARSLLCDAPILVLDEATSAVDTETEREIQNAIGLIAGLKTLIVIAHRLSTVKRADCIIVLKDGAVAEQGSHAELMEKDGVYKSLVEAQGLY